MELINRTPFHFGPVVGRLNFPGNSLTVIIKGTFDLNPDSVATPAEEQLFPTGDEFYPDDVDMQGSCRYESDFAWFKPKADLLLSGHCHSPNGEPVQACKVRFQVGPYEKTLNVFGDRIWKRPFGISTISDPEPFTKMELKYEKSFGGNGFKKNPVGKGVSKQETENGKKVRSLPNIEDPQNIIGSPRSRPEPAGFGPLGKMWKQRSSKMGNYKGKYLKERWPWLPMDFDWGHYNAAPPDMQAEGYLHGDEELYFENLHPEYPRYKSRLPGLRARCFVSIPAGSESEKDSFNEVPLNLDTLWIDMDSEKLVLVWRGWTEVLSEDYEEIGHVFIMSEPVDTPPQTVDQCHGLFIASLAEYEAEWSTAPEEQEEAEETEMHEDSEDTKAPEVPLKASPEPEADTDASAQKEKEAMVKKIEAQTTAIFTQLGISLDSLPPGMQQKTKEKQAKIIAQLTENDPEKLMDMERADLETRMKDTFAGIGVDIEKPPPVSAKAKSEQVRFIRELGLDSSMIEGDPLVSSFLNAVPALLPKMGVDPENLDPLINNVKKQKDKLFERLGIEKEEEEEKTEEQRKPEPVLTREIVQARASQGDSFADENLKGMDLSELDLAGLDFTGANFECASLVNANLSGAVLAETNLKETDLTGASLAEANLEGSDLSYAKMNGAVLKSANLSRTYSQNAILTDADLAEANLGYSDFTNSDLVGTNLTGAILVKANFNKARLRGAMMSGVDAADADLNAADLAESDMSGSNLSGANMTDTDLSKADLTGANLSNAILSKATLENAGLKEADFTGSDLSDSVLTRAVLNDAIFEKTNMKSTFLEEVEAIDTNFSETDLTDSKMSNSDFSGADFSKCILDGADLREAKMVDATVEGARGIKVNFSRADLTRLRASEGCDFTAGTFRYSNGFESIWHDAVLKDADFTLSQMHGADFTKAILQRADFSAADMKYSRFMKADMKLAKLLYMNLFEGSFEKADLTGADLSWSNMYGVEFLEAVLDHTRMKDTNLKMTKLG